MNLKIFYPQKNETIHKEFFYFFFGLIFALLLLFPYWLFGEFSSLGWFDEFNAIIPWYFTKSIINKNAEGFFHGYVGGNGSAFVSVLGNEKISLYRLLIQYFDIWVAGILIRAGGFILFFSGMYIFIRKVFQHSTPFYALSTSLFSVFVNYVPYGWTIGGLGWIFGIISWYCIIFFVDFKNIYIPYVLALLFSMIASITTPPIFLLPFLIYTFLFFISTHYKKNIFTIRTFLKWSIIWLLLLIFIFANWIDALRHILIDGAEFSARVHGVLSDRTMIDGNMDFLYNLIQLVKSNVFNFVLTVIRKPHSLLLVGYIFISLYVIQTKAYKSFLIFACYVFFIPMLLDTFFKLLEINFFSTYRWETLWLLQPILITFYLSILITKASHETNN